MAHRLIHHTEVVVVDNSMATLALRGDPIITTGSGTGVVAGVTVVKDFNVIAYYDRL